MGEIAEDGGDSGGWVEMGEIAEDGGDSGGWGRWWRMGGGWGR